MDTYRLFLIKKLFGKGSAVLPGGTKLVSLSAAAYGALSPKDENTIYIVTFPDGSMALFYGDYRPVELFSDGNTIWAPNETDYALFHLSADDIIVGEGLIYGAPPDFPKEKCVGVLLNSYDEHPVLELTGISGESLELLFMSESGEARNVAVNFDEVVESDDVITIDGPSKKAIWCGSREEAPFETDISDRIDWNNVRTFPRITYFAITSPGTMGSGSRITFHQYLPGRIWAISPAQLTKIEVE